jgi:hypothetical protein
MKPELNLDKIQRLYYSKDIRIKDSMFYAEPNSPRDFLMDTINNDENVNKDELALQMMLDDDDDAKSDDSFKKLMRENLKNKNENKKNKENAVTEEKEDEL